MALRKPVIGWALAVFAITGGFYAWRAVDEQAEADRDRAAQEEREQRARESEERFQDLRAESAGLMPEILGELALGITTAEARELRTQMRPKLGDAEPGLTMREEQLENGAQVVYAFAGDHLVRVQVMSILPGSAALSAHLTRMVEVYGRPTGAYDCPQTGNVPTRRFTWRRAHVTVADVFLVYGGRVSVTLYIAPNATMGASLLRANCQPIGRDDLEVFPAATLEQIREAGGAPGGL